MIVLIGGKLAPIASFSGSSDGYLMVTNRVVKDVEVIPGDYRKRLSRDLNRLSRELKLLSRDN